MAALANLLGRLGRGAARIPRKIDGAMWEKNLTVEELDSIPEDMEGVGYDPQTGQIIRVRETPDRTRPSRLAQGIGEALRAGVVAAANPTRGAVGTAQDYLGGMQAAEQDRQQRQDRATQQRQRQVAEDLAVKRQAREDRETESGIALNEARIGQEDAQAEMYRAQAEKALRQDASVAQVAQQLMDSGFSREEAISLITKQLFMPHKAVTTDEGVYDLNSATGAKTRLGSRPMPFNKAQLYKGEPGSNAQWLFAPMMKPDGTMAGEAKTLDAGVKVPTRKQPFTRPPRDRFRTETRADGKRVIVNLDTGEVRELFDAPKPGGSKPSLLDRWNSVVKNSGATSAPKADPMGIR